MSEINRKVFELKRAASADPFRPNIDGIQFGAGKAVATDGHILVEMDVSELKDVKPFLLPSVDAAAILKALPKRPPTDVAEIDVQKSNENGSAYFKVGNQSFDVQKPKTEFPDANQVQPTGEPTIKTALTIDVALKVLNTLKALGCRTVNVDVFTPGAPIRLTNDEKKVRALLMPCRR